MHRFWDIILKQLFEIIKPNYIVEVGSENGLNTEKILDYCNENNAKLSSIDPFPLFDVDDFKNRYGEHFEIFEELSLDVLPDISGYDMILLDGDHNWYTIYNELKAIENNQDNFPFIIFHDIAWPYARRDVYYNPDNIPKEFLHSYAKKGMYPGENDLLDVGGLNSHLKNAVDENTPKNGVLTGIEDFIKESDLDLTFIQIKAFHGLGFLYPKNDELDDCINELISKSNILAIVEEHYLKVYLNMNHNLDNHKKVINNNNKEIKYLNDKINIQNININNLNVKIGKKNNKIQNLKSRLNKKNNKIQNFKSRLNKKNNKIQNLKSKNNALKAKNKKLNKEKQDILLSRSWKLMKPFRVLKRVFRRNNG